MPEAAATATTPGFILTVPMPRSPMGGRPSPFGDNPVPSPRDDTKAAEVLNKVSAPMVQQLGNSEKASKLMFTLRAFSMSAREGYTTYTAKHQLHYSAYTDFLLCLEDDVGDIDLPFPWECLLISFCVYDPHQLQHILTMQHVKAAGLNIFSVQLFLSFEGKDRANWHTVLS